jgi:hypothetical protein
MTESSALPRSWSTCLEDRVCGCWLSCRDSDLRLRGELAAAPRRSPTLAPRPGTQGDTAPRHGDGVVGGELHIKVSASDDRDDFPDLAANCEP